MAARKGGRGQRPQRQVRRRILVVTEGTKTEPQYVEGSARYLRSHGATADVKSVPVGKDPVKVVSKCLEVRAKAADAGKEYDDCVGLVDVDEHASLGEACRLAERASVHLLISNLKFEAWLRWHVEGSWSALNTRQLDQAMTRLGLVEKKLIVGSFPFDQVDKACERARAAHPDLKPGVRGPNPSSAMPILVHLMRGGEWPVRTS